MPGKKENMKVKSLGAAIHSAEGEPPSDGTVETNINN